MVILTLVAIATFKMTPVYQATGRIAINKLDPGVLGFKDAGQGDDYDDPSELDTQVRILQSDSLALQVIKQLWTRDEMFDFEGRFFHIKKGYLEPKPIQQNALLRCFGR